MLESYYLLNLIKKKNPCAVSNLCIIVFLYVNNTCNAHVNQIAKFGVHIETEIEIRACKHAL